MDNPRTGKISFPLADKLFLYLFKIFNVNLIPSLPLSLGANLNQLEISLILEEIPDTSFIIKSNFSSFHSSNESDSLMS